MRLKKEEEYGRDPFMKDVEHHNNHLTRYSGKPGPVI